MKWNLLDSLKNNETKVSPRLRSFMESKFKEMIEKEEELLLKEEQCSSRSDEQNMDVLIDPKMLAQVKTKPRFFKYTLHTSFDSFSTGFSLN